MDVMLAFLWRRKMRERYLRSRDIEPWETVIIEYEKGSGRHGNAMDVMHK